MIPKQVVFNNYNNLEWFLREVERKYINWKEGLDTDDDGMLFYFLVLGLYHLRIVRGGTQETTTYGRSELEFSICKDCAPSL